MRPLFQYGQVYELERCLYEARKKLRCYWAGTLACLPSSTESPQYWNDAQTRYDLDCQAIIFDCLSGIEGLTIFSEESISPRVLGVGGNASLLIDPLDGTHNAVLGFPAYTSSVALYNGDKYVFGWVYDISRDLVYTAALGEGAYIQSPIIVKRLQTNSTRCLGDLRVSFLRPKEGEGKSLIEKIMWSANKIRICSCSSLELCFVAAGVLDAFIDIDMPGHERSCDIAAAELILREAGGALFYASGAPRFSLPPSTASLSDRGTLIALSSERLIRLIV